MSLQVPRPEREIRAVFDAETVTVYQAFRPGIAEPAARDGRFGPGFSSDRMTWIKPSFLWMMYRSGWATKLGQERVLAIRIRRKGFEWALENAALSHFFPEIHASEAAWRADVVRRPVRIQWDPERDMQLGPLPWRSIQIGLQEEASRRYREEWIVGIRDVTELARALHAQTEKPGSSQDLSDLPQEISFPLPPGGFPALGLRGLS